MKGDAKVIEFLNEALKNELTAVNQYWLHYRMLDNWGVAKLAHFERHESIDEMKHADRLSERILFLDGLPPVIWRAEDNGESLPSEGKKPQNRADFYIDIAKLLQVPH